MSEITDKLVSSYAEDQSIRSPDRLAELLVPESTFIPEITPRTLSVLRGQLGEETKILSERFGRFVSSWDPDLLSLARQTSCDHTESNKPVKLVELAQGMTKGENGAISAIATMRGDYYREISLKVTSSRKAKWLASAPIQDMSHLPEMNNSNAESLRKRVRTALVRNRLADILLTEIELVVDRQA